MSAAIALNQSDYTNYRANYVGASYFDYLDENKGFNSANFLYRTINNAPANAQPSSLVETWRNNLYLQNLSLGWREYLVPTIMTVGANYQYSVDISKAYDTTNNLVISTFEIQNRTGLAAGGGAVLPPTSAADLAPTSFTRGVAP